jgi:hypothetical protein
MLKSVDGLACQHESKVLTASQVKLKEMQIKMCQLRMKRNDVNP